MSACLYTLLKVYDYRSKRHRYSMFKRMLFILMYRVQFSCCPCRDIDWLTLRCLAVYSVDLDGFSLHCKQDVFTLSTFKTNLFTTHAQLITSN